MQTSRIIPRNDLLLAVVRGTVRTGIAAAVAVVAIAITPGDSCTANAQSSPLQASAPQDSASHPLPALAQPTTQSSKRDPFKPPHLKPKRTVDPSKPELERYDVSELRLTAIFGGMGSEPSASVENASGRGFIVKRGTTIGLNQGKVVEIRTDRILVEEASPPSSDGNSAKTTEMLLRGNP